MRKLSAIFCLTLAVLIGSETGAKETLPCEELIQTWKTVRAKGFSFGGIVHRKIVKSLEILNCTYHYTDVSAGKEIEKQIIIGTNLPPCRGDLWGDWDNCYGTVDYNYKSGGAIYVGEFKNGRPHGKGIETTFFIGQRYSVLEGIWKDGDFHFGQKLSPTIPTEKSSPQTEINPVPNNVISASSGSGFAISSDGHVITNNHVIEGCHNVKIHHIGATISAKVLMSDPKNDIALLKGDFHPSAVLPLSDQKPELLQDIYVAGYPFGRTISNSVKVTKGIVSSLAGLGNNFSNVQIDAALQPGNSGGPILSNRGNVVGVAVAKLDLKKILKSYGTIPESTNFGVKTSVVKNITDSLNLSLPKPNKSSISKSKLGKMISDGTYYLSCWMTMAQIEQMKSKKVIFQNLD